MCAVTYNRHWSCHSSFRYGHSLGYRGYFLDCRALDCRGCCLLTSSVHLTNQNREAGVKRGVVLMNQQQIVPFKCNSYLW